MNFTLLLGKEPKLLLNKLFIIVFLLTSIVFFSCGEKDEDVKPIGYDSPEALKQAAASVLNTIPSFTDKGYFIEDTTLQIVAGIEVETVSEWGIKFSLLTKNGTAFIKIYETPLLSGSFKESQANKIKFPSINYELAYYSSKSFFMGSGGGEVFSYIIDFNKKEIYKAHLVTDGSEGIKLFVSENTLDGGIKNFFIGNFKRDYPRLVIVKKDIEPGV